MRVFIDAGCYNGDTIVAFRNSKYYDSGYAIFALDANPNMAKFFIGRSDVTFINKAVWIANGKQSFYLNIHKDVSRGASLIKGKTTGNLGREVVVDTIDFSQWMKSAFDLDSDYIILKMDIEGAEYDVLRKMIDDGVMPHVKVLILDAHYKKIGLDKKVHVGLMKEISALGVKIKDKI